VDVVGHNNLSNNIVHLLLVSKWQCAYRRHPLLVCGGDVLWLWKVKIHVETCTTWFITQVVLVICIVFPPCFCFTFLLMPSE
jgi:hypothetical protein